MRLCPRNLARLPADVGTPQYDRDEQEIGIVHFGIGAFHRAHQAWYTDMAMARGDRDWAISGVSLRSEDVAAQLNPQDGLYTVVARSGSSNRVDVIGAVKEVLFADTCAQQIVERIASPTCRIVSFTVTEKGYARASGNDLDPVAAQRSFYPLVSAGLRERKDRGLPGITLLSCDNLGNNGAALRHLFREWLRQADPALEEWFCTACSSPSTMVDRIVPRTTTDDRKELRDRIGMADEGAVFTEAFSQWVIEDDFVNGKPRWHEVGAQLVEDVAAYELAKLRMLNGAHSLLAYAGLRAGHDFVHEAVTDPHLHDLARRLMIEEAMPTIDAAPGQRLDEYADELMARFANPAVRHRLAQIAMDGTQKIPQRWLETAASLQRDRMDFTAIRAGFDAWLWHIEDGRFLDDPLQDVLASRMRSGGREAVLGKLFGAQNDERPLWQSYTHLLGAFANASQRAELRPSL